MKTKQFINCPSTDRESYNYFLNLSVFIVSDWNVFGWPDAVNQVTFCQIADCALVCRHDISGMTPRLNVRRVNMLHPKKRLVSRSCRDFGVSMPAMIRVVALPPEKKHKVHCSLLQKLQRLCWAIQYSARLGRRTQGLDLEVTVQKKFSKSLSPGWSGSFKLL